MSIVKRVASRYLAKNPYALVFDDKIDIIQFHDEQEVNLILSYGGDLEIHPHTRVLTYVRRFINKMIDVGYNWYSDPVINQVFEYLEDRSSIQGLEVRWDGESCFLFGPYPSGEEIFNDLKRFLFNNEANVQQKILPSLLKREVGDRDLSLTVEHGSMVDTVRYTFVKQITYDDGFVRSDDFKRKYKSFRRETRSTLKSFMEEHILDAWGDGGPFRWSSLSVETDTEVFRGRLVGKLIYTFDVYM